MALPEPAYATGYRDPSLRQSLPFLCAWVDKVSLRDDGRGATWAGYKHELHIQIWLVGSDEASLEKQLERYRRAIWDVLWQNQTLGGAAAQLIATASKRLWSEGSTKLRGVEWIAEATRVDTAG